MRRMRGGFWSYLWFGVPALAFAVAGYGIYSKAHRSSAVATVPAENLKVGEKLSSRAHDKGKKSGTRAPASFMEKFGEKLGTKLGIIGKATKNEDAGKAPHIPLGKGAEPDEDADSDEVVANSGGYAVTPGPATRTIAAVDASPGSSDNCDRAEIRGSSPEAARVTKKDWNKVMDSFHASKRELSLWLAAQDFPKPIVEVMQARVNSLKIQRPPAVEEPDLSWRGIGIYTSAAEDPLVRVGTGFVQRLAQNTDLAKFEMTRLVAQSWAPCELEKDKVSSIWSPLLKCLGATVESCHEGTNSESGWAVSTSVAFATHPPGSHCSVPAFTDPKTASCLSAWKPLAAVHVAMPGRRVAAEPSEPWGGDEVKPAHGRK